MDLFERLSNNKGTVSSVLGKELAVQVLAGDDLMLEKAVELTRYDLDNVESKNIQTGAAKIVEIVVEKSPELVAPYLESLLLALEAKEPQTRWMVIRSFGFCATMNEAAAKEAMPYAQKYIKEKEGLCIAGAADLYLGDYGTLSRENTAYVLPILLEAIETCVKNEEDWIIESLIKISAHMKGDEIDQVMPFLMQYSVASKKTTIKRVAKFMKCAGVAPKE